MAHSGRSVDKYWVTNSKVKQNSQFNTKRDSYDGKLKICEDLSLRIMTSTYHNFVTHTPFMTRCIFISNIAIRYSKLFNVMENVKQPTSSYQVKTADVQFFGNFVDTTIRQSQSRANKSIQCIRKRKSSDCVKFDTMETIYNKTLNTKV